MRKYPNFYEGLQEAQARLCRTIVLYNDEEGPMPYFVIAITEHVKDGIFRIYLDPVGSKPVDSMKDYQEVLSVTANYHPDHPELGKMLDTYLAKHKNSGIVRKHINSPYFNFFRPFPLGMCNVGTQTFFLERQPMRPSMHQGLVRNAIWETLITAGSRLDNPKKPMETVNFMSSAFKDCILGDHYSPQEVLRALLNPNIANDAHAIGREFALVRGPLDMIFLGYRTDIIGMLTKNNFDTLRLGRDFGHCREVVEELKLFQTIV